MKCKQKMHMKVWTTLSLQINCCTESWKQNVVFEWRPLERTVMATNTVLQDGIYSLMVFRIYEPPPSTLLRAVTGGGSSMRVYAHFVFTPWRWLTGRWSAGLNQTCCENAKLSMHSALGDDTTTWMDADSKRDPESFEQHDVGNRRDTEMSSIVVREHKVQKYSPVAVLMMGSCVIYQWNRKSMQIKIFDGASSAFGAENP
jgi:hypothetical protein